MTGGEFEKPEEPEEPDEVLSGDLDVSPLE
jgi:hypothetical protein